MLGVGAALILLPVFAAGGKPKVDLRPLSNVSTLRAGQCSVDVRFRLVVEARGAEDYYCPRVEWLWEDGTRSTDESDCPPFEEAAADDRRKAWIRTHAIKETGRHVVRVRLYKGDRTIRIVETAATVVGFGMAPEMRQSYGCP